MPVIEPPDSHYVSAAQGWIELGNLTEAKAELDRLSPSAQRHPGVLEAYWLIHAKEQNWAAALAVAKSLLQVDPQRASGWLHQAYALRRVPGGGLKVAWDALLPASEAFPDEPLIPYNLACYACQMGELDQARHWLRIAFQRGNHSAVKHIALADSDLAPLWDELKTW